MDRRPWKCINCGDRFARDQTPKGTHMTICEPRDDPKETPE